MVIVELVARNVVIVHANERRLVKVHVQNHRFPEGVLLPSREFFPTWVMVAHLGAQVIEPSLDIVVRWFEGVCLLEIIERCQRAHVRLQKDSAASVPCLKCSMNRGHIPVQAVQVE